MIGPESLVDEDEDDVDRSERCEVARGGIMNGNEPVRGEISMTDLVAL